MKIKIFAFAITICFLMLAGSAIAGHQQGQQDGIVLTTNKDVYGPGDPVIIKLTNCGDEAILVHPDLELVSTIYDVNTGQEVKMAGPAITEIIMLLEPGKSLNWKWDQTYWMFEYTPDGIVYSRSNGMQVPSGEYGITVRGLDVNAYFVIE